MAERRARKPRLRRSRISSQNDERKHTAWSTSNDAAADSCSSSSSASEEFICFSPRRVNKKSKRSTRPKPPKPMAREEEENLSMKYILQLIESGEIEASEEVINNLRGANPAPSSSVSAPMTQTRTAPVHRSRSSSSTQNTARREKKARKRSRHSERHSNRSSGEHNTRRSHRSRRSTRSSNRDRARRATKEARSERRSSSTTTRRRRRTPSPPSRRRIPAHLRASDEGGINPFEEDYKSLTTLRPHLAAQVNNDQIASDEAFARELQVMESLGLGGAVGLSSTDPPSQLPNSELLFSSDSSDLEVDSGDRSPRVTRQEVMQFLTRLHYASTILRPESRETRERPAIFSTLHNILNKMPKGASKKDTLPVFEYKGHGSNSEDTTCCICLEKFEIGDKLKILPCFHKFHEKCIDTWLTDHNVCPICKYNVDE